MRNRKVMIKVAAAIVWYFIIEYTNSRAFGSAINSAEHIKIDSYNEPLPDGVLARMGTIRFLHNGKVKDLVYTTDGQNLLSVGSDNMIRVWDKTGKLIKTIGLPLGTTRPIAFSRKGNLLAVQDRDKTVQVIDARTGKNLARLFKPKTRACYATFPPNEAMLAWTDPRGEIHIWDLATSREKLVFSVRKNEEICAISFSPDGKHLLVGGVGNMAWICEVNSGKVVGNIKVPLRKAWPREKIRIGVVFSPDGRQMAIIGAGRVFICDATSRRLVREISCEANHTSVVAFSPDGKQLACGGFGPSEVLLWEIGTGRRLHVFDIGLCHNPELGIGVITALTFSPDGRTVAAACEDHTVRLWNVDSGKERFKRIGHIGRVESIAFNPDGTRLATRGGDGTIRLWDPSTGLEHRHIPFGADSPPRWHSVCFSTDGTLIATVSDQSTVSFWNANTGKLASKYSIAPIVISSFAISPDGNSLALEGFSPDAERHVYRIYDLCTRRLILNRSENSPTIKDAAFLNLTPDTPKPITFSPDSKFLAYPVVHKGIVFCDTFRGEPLHCIELATDPVICMSFSSDGRFLLSGTGGYNRLGVFGAAVRLWDMQSYTMLLQLKAHQTPVRSVTISGDSRMMASAGDGGVIRIWELATGEEVHRFEIEGVTPTCVAFAPDGNSLASGMSNGTALRWRLAPSNWRSPVGAFTAEERQSRWRTLAGMDAVKAYRTVWDLAATPADTVAFLKERLHPLPVVPPERIDHLIADLDNDSFSRREAATRELSRLGTIAESALRKAVAKPTSAEVRLRAEALLKAVPGWLIKDAATLQTVRAIWLLQRIATPEARSLLEKLAAGAPAARQTQEAKAALLCLDHIKKR